MLELTTHGVEPCYKHTKWEKATRETDGRIYPWGETISCDYANYNWNCVGDTSEVGDYPVGASPYDALDMVGNVYEWVADWYGENYYSISPGENPCGPSSGEYRVLRGGSWNNESRNVRAANRNRNDPDNHNNNIGFRCARPPSKGYTGPECGAFALFGGSGHTMCARKASAGYPCLAVYFYHQTNIKNPTPFDAPSPRWWESRRARR